LLPAGKLVDLRQDNVDVAIRYGKGGWAGATVCKLMSAGHVAVAATTYIEGRRIECFDDLKGARWLMAKAQSEERYWVKTGGIDLDDENVTVFPTAQLTREAALAGLGVAVIPEPIADPHVKSGKLVVLCVEENSPAAYHVLTRPEIISPSRDVFVKWLKNEAKT
jgi:LysR family glycine cleavage system transcriptional activator